jgi:hypothetical protein
MVVVEARRRLQPIRRFTCRPCVLSIVRIIKRKCIVVNSAKHLEKIKWLFTHISSDQVRVIRVFFFLIGTWEADLIQVHHTTCEQVLFASFEPIDPIYLSFIHRGGLWLL